MGTYFTFVCLCVWDIGGTHREAARYRATAPYALGVSNELFSSPSHSMKWDASRTQGNITLSANGRTASNSKSSWSMTCGDSFLNEGVVEVEIDTENADNLSMFVGVCSPAYWGEVTAAQAADEGEEALPRDSKHAICMHGDGRCFIKGQEKDWGLMKLVTGGTLHMLLDFERGVVTFRLSHTVRGKLKETAAEIPGLFASATLVLCCGGRDQEVSISRCAPRRRVRGDGGDGDGDEEASAGPSSRRRVRDVFADALGSERVAPVPFSAPQSAMSYEQQIIDMARSTETSN